MQNDNAHDRRFSYVLALIFLLFAAGIITGGYLNYRDYAQHFRREIENQLSAIADLKMAELVQWRNERWGDGNTFFKNPAFSSLVRRYFENSQDGDAREKLDAWLGLVKKNHKYNRISLFDENGVRRLTMPADAPLASIDLLQHITEVQHSKKMVFQDFYRNEYDQHIYLSFLLPVIDTQDNNRVLGVLVLRIDPVQYIYPLLDRWPSPSQTAETLLVRREGDSALFLNELKYKKDTALNLRIPLTMVNTPAVQAVLGHEGLFEGLDYRGVQVIADMHRVPDSPWFLVARMDTAEVYAPLKERLWIMVLFIIALIFCAGMGLLFFWRQQSFWFYREQLKAAEELAESRQLLLDITNNSLTLIYIFDTEGRFMLANRKFTDLFGTSIEKLIGQTRLDILPQELAVQHRSNDLEVMRERKLMIFEEENQEADGTHTYLTMKYPLFRSDGTLYAVGGMSTDITERKRLEDQLTLQARIATIFLTCADEELYNQILTIVLDAMQSPFGVFGYLDKDGALIVPTLTHQIWDRCRITDKTIRFPRETWGDSSWPRAIRQKKPNYSNEPSTKTPEGHIILDRHISMPIILGGRVIGLFQLGNKATDYTDADVQKLQSIAGHVAPILSARLDRERYEKELQETNAELTRFNYTMSHDLRSPLVTVKTFLGYLEKDLQKQDAERIEKDFAFIRGAADKMGQLLDELLELTRIGRTVNPEVEAPLHDIVHEALLLVAGRIAQRGVKIEITQKRLLLRGDRIRLVELFQNLIDNAVKFMGDQKEPKVEIGLKTKNNENFLFVRDNGMGLDPRHIGKLFGLFERLNPEIEGTGMGLALVKRIVEVHGGTIWVESEGLGKGACFWFTLQGK